ncbi:CBS domain-containing protein [Dyella japonica]|uniref:CBS domain-containing protein n=1 Tax=Dyella japonica TaxID=231455 RepID=A0ABV2JP29_9GAMM
MKVSDAMNGQVRTALASDDVVLAMQIMVGAKVSGLPVVDGEGALVGILTEGDLLRRPEIDTVRQRPRWLEVILGPRRLAQEYVDTHSRRVADLMTADVVTIDEDAPLSEAVSLMEEHHIRRLPVTHKGQLNGMLSRSDLLRAFIHAVPRRAETVDVSDAHIRECIDNEILRCPWITRSAIVVAVERGVVEIDGVVTNEAMRDAVRVLAENVPGVHAVRNRLTIEDPATSYL